MGNYAFFRGCASREALLQRRTDAGPQPGATEVELDAKYSIPLFWLAGFAPEDLVSRKVYDAAQPDQLLYEYVMPCAGVREYAARARVRRAGMLSLVPAALGDYYDEWIRFVERRWSKCVSMDDFEECGLRLRGALRALQAADRGEPVRDTAALQWFAGFEDLARERLPGESAEDAVARWRNQLGGSGFLPGSSTLLWPTRPTPAELAFAASLPEAARHEPGSPQADAADYAAMVRRGIVRDDPLGRLSLAAKQLAGEVPLGVDAPTRGLRKAIGGGGELLAVLRDGFIGMIFTVLGPAFIWASWHDPIYWTGVGIGAALLAAGLWLLRMAWRSQRRLRAILRA
jgi:hypothetical protein